MRFPAITLSIVSVSLMAFAVPQLSDVLVYDRGHILAGQLWRLVTAPFVHFSASHLVWNLLVLATAGCAVEALGHRKLGLLWVYVLAVSLPGLLFLAMKPDLARYGGLSALATGAAAYLCLCRAQQSGGDRMLWMAILALLIVKILVEGVADTPIFARAAALPFRVLPSAHAIGVAAAVIVIGLVSGGRRRGVTVKPLASSFFEGTPS